jgi:hypothetical protein
MSPDEELAALIAERLVERGLIEAGRRAEVAGKIAAGRATPEDWYLWIELGPAGRAGGGDDAED